MRTPSAVFGALFPKDCEDLDSLVRSRRLELPRVAPQRPQRCASTNSATTARGEARGVANALRFGKGSVGLGAAGEIFHRQVRQDHQVWRTAGFAPKVLASLAFL